MFEVKKELVKKVEAEEKVAIAKWGHNDRTPSDLVCALCEESGEVAHAVNHSEGKEQLNQEIVEAIGILSRLYNMVNNL
jgi:NTP pyrophosphatase (non-canonical NTP hydrolase)